MGESLSAFGGLKSVKMKLSVREWQPGDIEQIVDYFVLADADFLNGMGAEKHKLPEREAWIQKLHSEFKKPNFEKNFIISSG